VFAPIDVGGVKSDCKRQVMKMIKIEKTMGGPIKIEKVRLKLMVKKLRKRYVPRTK
jgi:hypothetical protein